MTLHEFKKIWRIFAPGQRRGYIVLLVMMTLGALLEMVSVGSLLPVLALMTRPELVQNAGLQPMLGFLGNPGHTTLVLFAMTVLVGVNALRVGYLIFMGWRQTQFVKSFTVQLSERLYAGYLNQPYAFHLQRNSAQLIRNTTGEVAVVAVSVQGSLMLLSEVMVLLGISALLFVVDPLGILIVMSLLGLAAWWFYHRTRSSISAWGEQREHHEGMRIQQLQQGLGSAKEIKLLGIESLALKEYAPHNRGGAHATQRYTFVQALPRLWLELLAFCGMGAFVVVMLVRGAAVESVVPTLGLFGAAAFRLMPSVNRILGAMQNIRFGIPPLNNLSRELEGISDGMHPKPTVHGRPWFCRGIEISDLTFSYPLSPRPALAGVMLKIPARTSVGFVGGSGAGKSTLVDVILGLLTPTSGSLKVDGRDVQECLRDWQGQVGYVPQSIYLTDDTLRRNVAFGLPEAEIDDDAVRRAIDMAQLDTFVASLPEGLGAMVGERGVRLSGGQRQRIGIARALYYNPPVLVLDEATSALDNETERNLMESINALHGDKTLIIVAHRLTTVERCDVVHRLEDGRLIASGSPMDVLGVGVGNGSPQQEG